jgi:hypothetical protein
MHEADFRDGAHGFAVWALALFVGGLLAASGTAGALKTAVQAGAAVTGGAAAGAASNPAVGQAATNQISMTPTDYAVDRIFAPAPAGGGAAAGGAAAPAAGAAGGATPGAGGGAMVSRAPVTRIFAASLKSGQLEPRDKATLVATVQQQTGLPQAEAEKRVDESYNDLKTAEQKARDAAEAARKAALITAFAVAATLLLGAAAACAGAAAGARHRHERTAITWFGAQRFW